MDDAELARAAAVYFGGRAQAEHLLTCDDCHDDVRCKRYPYPKSRRTDAAPRRTTPTVVVGVRQRSRLEPTFSSRDDQRNADPE